MILQHQQRDILQALPDPALAGVWTVSPDMAPAGHRDHLSRNPAEHDIDWHPAPRRQYIINLDAGVKITASDGESRVIGVGEVILVEDTTGKGHLSQHVEGKIRHSIFVPID